LDNACEPNLLRVIRNHGANVEDAAPIVAIGTAQDFRSSHPTSQWLKDELKTCIVKLPSEGLVFLPFFLPFTDWKTALRTKYLW
jgi:hypothetical protein